MTAIVENKPKRPGRLSARSIPPALIYEVWDGKPIYYKGYKDVLAGKKTIEEVMSCSDVQGAIVYALGLYIGIQLNRKHYLITSNGSGLHLGVNDNLANDISIFDRAVLGKLKGKFFDVPPKVVIEVDIRADVTDFSLKSDGYLINKSQKLIDFGVERVIWVLTEPRKTYVIDRNDPTWYVIDWSEPITVLDDCILNIKQLLEDEEITY